MLFVANSSMTAKAYVFPTVMAYRKFRRLSAAGGQFSAEKNARQMPAIQLQVWLS
jgi:hypothetical protein